MSEPRGKDKFLGDLFEACKGADMSKVTFLSEEKVPQEYVDQVKKIGDDLGIDWNTIDMNELLKGIKVEREHADVTKGDLEPTVKIAAAHLKEDPQYYVKLEQVESGATPAADKAAPAPEKEAAAAPAAEPAAAPASEKKEIKDKGKAPIKENATAPAPEPVPAEEVEKLAKGDKNDLANSKKNESKVNEGIHVNDVVEYNGEQYVVIGWAPGKAYSIKAADAEEQQDPDVEPISIPEADAAKVLKVISSMGESKVNESTHVRANIDGKKANLYVDDMSTIFKELPIEKMGDAIVAKEKEHPGRDNVDGTLTIRTKQKMIVIHDSALWFDWPEIQAKIKKLRSDGWEVVTDNEEDEDPDKREPLKPTDEAVQPGTIVASDISDEAIAQKIATEQKGKALKDEKTGKWAVVLEDRKPDPITKKTPQIPEAGQHRLEDVVTDWRAGYSTDENGKKKKDSFAKNKGDIAYAILLRDYSQLKTLYQDTDSMREVWIEFTDDGRDKEAEKFWVDHLSKYTGLVGNEMSEAKIKEDTGVIVNADDKTVTVGDTPSGTEVSVTGKDGKKVTVKSEEQPVAAAPVAAAAPAVDADKLPVPGAEPAPGAEPEKKPDELAPVPESKKSIKEAVQSFEIFWKDLTPEAQERLKPLYHGNIGLSPLAVIDVEEEALGEARKGIKEDAEPSAAAPSNGDRELDIREIIANEINDPMLKAYNAVKAKHADVAKQEFYDIAYEAMESVLIHAEYLQESIKRKIILEALGKGKVWLVHDPSPDSEILGDFVSSYDNAIALRNYIMGTESTVGTFEKERHALHTDEASAMADAKARWNKMRHGDPFPNESKELGSKQPVKESYIALLIRDGDVLDQTSIDENNPELARELFKEFAAQGEDSYKEVLDTDTIEIEPYEEDEPALDADDMGMTEKRIVCRHLCKKATLVVKEQKFVTAFKKTWAGKKIEERKKIARAVVKIMKGKKK